MNTTAFRRTLAVLVTTGAMVGLGAGIASAATPAGADQLGSSEGIHLYNNSFDTLVLTKVSGDNEGVPAVGGVLQPGQGYQDFEVTMRAAKTTTVTADYNVLDPSDNAIGTAAVKLSLDAVGVPSVSGTFTAADGSKLPLETQSTGGASLKQFEVVGNSSTPVTVNASDPTAKSLVEKYCTQKNTGASCSYHPSGRTSGAAMKLLAESYNPTGGDNEPANLSVSSGYNSSTSDSWTDTFSVQAELADVFSLGVQATYGQSVTWQNTFTASASIQVNPGSTGYIWGQVPQIEYTGTMQVSMGNTTYDIQNATLTTPDPTRALSDFHMGSWAGQDPLNSPTNPPANAVTHL